ncbi:MAG: nitrogenase, partial [Acidobacteriota bacterium]|nr:nitrogenase [Acidobacteriota bacterium]
MKACEKNYEEVGADPVTQNACKLCTPLGACLAFRGVEGCIPFLHGSQGCSTYIRRYLISHFREPIDIASSNFHEETAVFGGSTVFTAGVGNVLRQYNPAVVGAATTCLSETIGEDMGRLLMDFHKANPTTTPVVHVSTASYRGTHIDGFHDAVRALVDQLAVGGAPLDRVNIFPGMVSAADLRHLKEIFEGFGLAYTLLADYSESMDGETWSRPEKQQPGGTLLADIRLAGRSKASLEFGRTLELRDTAGTVLAEKFGVTRHLLGLPIGIRETDRLFDILRLVSGRTTPEKYQGQRGRLLDAYVDGHKYVFEKRAIVYGEEDLVIGLASFLCEIGVTPVVCASGGRSRHFEESLRKAVPELPEETVIKEDFDFADIEAEAEGLKPDFLIGSSKGYAMSKRLDVPLIRVGFPIHDRIGGQRIHHLGYLG